MNQIIEKKLVQSHLSKNSTNSIPQTINLNTNMIF